MVQGTLLNLGAWEPLDTERRAMPVLPAVGFIPVPAEDVTRVRVQSNINAKNIINTIP